MFTKIRIVVAGAILSLLAFGALVAYLFRTETLDNPTLGLVYHKYRWGKAHQMTADTNRDGSIDSIAVFDGTSRRFWSHDSPVEYWEDPNYDGVFEVHIVLKGSTIQRVELDENADGEYERILTGAEAVGFYGSRALPGPEADNPR